MNRWSTTLVLVSVLITAAPGSAQQPPATPRAGQAFQLQLQAEDLARAGKIGEAAATFQRAAELAATDWVLWDTAGWAHLDSRQAPAALKAFEQSRKVAPPDTPVGGVLIAHYVLGNKQQVLDLMKQAVAPDQVEQATAMAQLGMAARPNTADWNYALAYLYSRVLRNSRRALAPAEDAAQKSPDRAGVWLLLVEINQDLNRAPAEEAAAVRYLELAGDTADAYRIRGQRHTSLQQYGAAIEEYQEGIGKHPTAGALYFQLARVQERVARPKEAEATYRKLIDLAAIRKLESVHAQARAQLANFHARQRNYTEAEKYYREAAARPEAGSSTVSTWGALLALSGKWSEAAKAMDAAADRQAKTMSASASEKDELLADRYRAAVAHLAAGERPQAKTGLEATLKAPQEARTSPALEAAAFLVWLDESAANRARLAYQRGDEGWGGFTWRPEAAAEGEFEIRGRFSPQAGAWRLTLLQVLKLHPDCWPAQYALARIYASAGFTNEALDLLTRSTQNKAEWWAPYYALGQYYARKGDRDKGVPALQKVVQMAPENRLARALLNRLNSVQPGNQ